MNNNPWDLKPDDARTADGLYTFIIFCEDETSELLYFKWFETPLIKVNAIGRQKSMLINVKKAISYCTSNGILAFQNNKHSLTAEGIELWSVFDRDTDENSDLLAESNDEFNISIGLAENSDIQVAWSNDAFELWVLLHLMEIDPTNADTRKRLFYYDTLTGYFQKHPSPNEDLKKALVHKSFSYKRDMKHRDNFANIVRPEILPFTHLAIERAKKLAEHHQDKQNHYDKKPCTMVHLLVSSLLDKGKKVIPAQP